jgi:hypothetical protein
MQRIPTAISPPERITIASSPGVPKSEREQRYGSALMQILWFVKESQEGNPKSGREGRGRRVKTWNTSTRTL